ncbi:GNAT family N-acetyltransferase [Roseburia inulinivorans]
MLRKLEQKDVPYMLEWMHDPAVACNFRADFKNMTEQNAIEFVKNSFTEENQNFAFVDDNDEYMGTISLKHISATDKNAEYAIVTRTKAQGTGLAYNATQDILKYAFEELGLHRVYLNVLEENERANHFYKKCGFQYEGKFVDHLFLEGRYKNLNWYGICR